MKKRQGWKVELPRLAVSLPLLALSASLAFASERPRPEGFPDYAKFIQALFDYERAQEAAAKAARSKKSDDSSSKLCRDDGTTVEGGDKKKNSCEGRDLVQESRVPEKAEPRRQDEAVAGAVTEDLDEAVARAQILMPGLVEHHGATRSTFNSFPLAEIPAFDLGEAGVSGLLGLFNLTGGLKELPPTSSRLRPDGSITLDSEGGLQLRVENLLLDMSELELLLLGMAGFGNIQTTLSTDIRTIDGGIGITMSAETRISGLYIVDRDGTLHSPFDRAGAVFIDRLAILLPRLEITIRGVQTTSGDSLLRIGTFSPQPITVDLRDTRIGVADARADGTRVGTPADVLVFGPTSILTVMPGTRLTMDIGSPSDGRPLVTLNGRVGDVILPDMTLMAQRATVINIGRLTLRNINLVNTRVYVERDEITVDAGTGLNNFGLGLERIRMGSIPTSGMIGDFYMEETRVHRLRFTATPH